MPSPRMSGLGRGLSSLIPTSQESELAELTETEELLHSMVDAGFELLDEHDDVDMAAYLHLSKTGTPLFFLHRPAFASLTPTSAFRLFHQVATLSNESASTGRFSFDGWRGIYRRSAGRQSDGIYIVASSETAFGDREADSLQAKMKAISSVTHQAEIADGVADLANVRLVAEVEDAKTSVQATITLPSGQLSVGQGASLSADEAVVAAVLDALETGFAFVDMTEIDIADRRAILTTLSHPDGTPSFGLAVGTSDSLTTAAYSALRAVSV